METEELRYLARQIIKTYFDEAKKHEYHIRVKAKVNPFSVNFETWFHIDEKPPEKLLEEKK